MNRRPDPPTDQEPFPERFGTGETVLVATAGDPSVPAVDIRVLCQYGDVADRVLIVTTTRSATQTVETVDHFCSETARPALGFVETTSNQPSVSAIYDDVPVILTPSPGDLERLVVALTELCRDDPPAHGDRHLIVRSLTPLLEAAPVDRVCRVLERISGLRTSGGLCLWGIDYTAHDETTMAAVVEGVDSVLWVTQDGPNDLAFEYQLTRGSVAPPCTVVTPVNNHK